MYSAFFDFVFLLLSYCLHMGHVEGIKDAGDYIPLPKRAPCPRNRPAKRHPVGWHEKQLTVRHADKHRGDFCNKDETLPNYRALAAWAKFDVADWYDQPTTYAWMEWGIPDALDFLEELDNEYPFLPYYDDNTEVMSRDDIYYYVYSHPARFAHRAYKTAVGKLGITIAGMALYRDDYIPVLEEFNLAVRELFDLYS